MFNGLHDRGTFKHRKNPSFVKFGDLCQQDGSSYTNCASAGNFANYFAKINASKTTVTAFDGQQLLTRLMLD